MRTNILSHCRVRHCYESMQMRENVTCESVLFTHPAGGSRLLSAVNDPTATRKKTRQNATLSILMSKGPKQVSLFFDAAHSMSSEVIDIL